jgi:hypothetical protein
MDSYVTYGSFTQQFYNYAQKKVTDYKMSAATNTTAEVKGLNWLMFRTSAMVSV